MSEIYSYEDFLNHGLNLLYKFNPDDTDFLTWFNFFEFIVDYLRIEKKNFFLLTMLEPQVCDYIKSQIQPVSPFHLPYEMIICILEEKYSNYGKFLITYIRFTCRVQYIGESVTHFYEALKKLIYTYNCGPDANDILMEHFINGLKNNEIKEELKNISNLSPKIALYIARNMEYSKKPFIII
ncbi:hypothetical protein M0802_015879 [Mischocyttarus mexicanus]|nr:hypothetical protein M0802_015879 [Mischocyttarus mexicanus]